MAEQIALNIDCMEYMKTLPDNAFELVVAGPPYGDAGSEFKCADKSSKAEETVADYLLKKQERLAERIANADTYNRG